MSNKVGDTYEPISEHLGINTATGETSAPSAKASTIFDHTVRDRDAAAKKENQSVKQSLEQAKAQVQSI